ncbi:unnamed protein product [Urochloa decumbens]|uniref:Bacterial surface antigen (D15) domain-containing protein n=1 Tax=Urochloa decumbens TaxID=240449 RepID=A0ABC9B8M8_9POAL
MAIISDAGDPSGDQETGSASPRCSGPRVILSSSPIPEPPTSPFPNRSLSSAINAAAAASTPGRSRSNHHHGGWPGAVFAGFLSRIFPAAAPTDDGKKKNPAPPVSGHDGAARRKVIPADRFSCVNIGVGDAAPPHDDGGEGHPGGMAECERKVRRRRQESDCHRRPCILPESVREDVEEMVRDHGALSPGLLRRVTDRVERWYHGEGFACATVVSFGNPSSGELACEVLEGDITRVEYKFVDNLGNVVDGKTRIPVIERELPQQLRPGHIFNIGAKEQALKHINSLGLFSDAKVNPLPDETKQGGVVVEIKLREAEPRSAGLDTSWSIVPGDEGQPTLASIKPGGTGSFGFHNISGLNRSLAGSLTSSNLVNPKDDLSFHFEYEHPYLDGVENLSKNRSFKTSFFNTRKLSPIFVAGPGMEAAPPIWIDRVGFKANITEKFTQQSTLTYGLVLEQITARDENKNIRTHGSRVLPGGALHMDGPPTTFSGTGVDQMAFLQANLTRDNTEFVNGATIGDRCIFQVDQGLGIGSKNPLFNRHQLSLTKFIQLNKQKKGPGKPPPAVLALHGRYAGCVGDLPSYDAFALGGPHSVRGYSMGELGAARNLLEVATELRIPVAVMGKQVQVYAFAEHGNDLGSSKDVQGNPTEFFQRAGCGSSYGVGIKFGALRAEYTMDRNTGTGSFSLGFGERF